MHLAKEIAVQLQKHLLDLSLWSRAALHVSLIICTMSPAQADDVSKNAMLNNQGVIAINRGKWDEAIAKLEEVAKLDSEYKRGRDNLVLAYEGKAKSLSEAKDYDGALKFLHRAIYLKDYCMKEQQHNWAHRMLGETISQMGKDPESADTHLSLARNAILASDDIGAYVEYSEALNLSSNPETQKSCDAVLERLRACTNPIFRQPEKL